MVAGSNITDATSKHGQVHLPHIACVFQMRYHKLLGPFTIRNETICEKSLVKTINMYITKETLLSMVIHKAGERNLVAKSVPSTTVVGIRPRGRPNLK